MKRGSLPLLNATFLVVGGRMIVMKKLLYVIAICFFINIANVQAEVVLRQFKDRYCYDGDTCYVTINGEDTKIRLLELDTPEISKPKCDQELEWGLRARDYINNLIENAKTIEIKTEYQKDFFGRTLAHLIIDEEDVSALLVKNDLGVVYKKGHKMNWCDK